MRRMVVYQSKTGFTGQYAMWIANGLNCEAVDIKQTTEKNDSRAGTGNLRGMAHGEYDPRSGEFD